MASASGTLEQACFLGGAVVETLFYGFYFCLLLSTVYLVTRRGLGHVHDSTARISLPSKIFFSVAIVMFVLATFHEILTIYRLIRGFGLMLGAQGTPLSYYQVSTWDNTAHTVMNAIVIWIADGLAIYRCYMLWGQSRSPYRGLVVVLPIVLLLSAMGVNITLMVYYEHPFMSYEDLTPILRANYPLLFAQNVVTTVFIAYALTRQHGQSTSVSVNGTQSGVNVLTVARIVIESALLYTVEMFILIILNSVDHPSQYVVRGAIIPTIGIVFLLITVRVHLAQEGSEGKALHSSAPSIFLAGKNDKGWTTPGSEKSYEHA